MIEVVHTISDESELTAEAVLWKETLTHAATHPLGSMSPASFVTHNQKRVTFRTAIDHLLSAVETDTPERLELSADSASPFGQVAVEQSACTLCMACVSTVRQAHYSMVSRSRNCDLSKLIACSAGYASMPVRKTLCHCNRALNSTPCGPGRRKY